MPDAIEVGMRKLKLGGLARDWRSIPLVAVLLDLELKGREVNRINRMVHTAGFNVLKTFEGFEWTKVIELPNSFTREYMENLRFIPPDLSRLRPRLRRHGQDSSGNGNCAQSP